MGPPKATRFLLLPPMQGWGCPAQVPAWDPRWPSWTSACVPTRHADTCHGTGTVASQRLRLPTSRPLAQPRALQPWPRGRQVALSSVPRGSLPPKALRVRGHRQGPVPGCGCPGCHMESPQRPGYSQNPPHAEKRNGGTSPVTHRPAVSPQTQDWGPEPCGTRQGCGGLRSAVPACGKALVLSLGTGTRSWSCQQRAERRSCSRDRARWPAPQLVVTPVLCGSLPPRLGHRGVLTWPLCLGRHGHFFWTLWVACSGRLSVTVDEMGRRHVRPAAWSCEDPVSWPSSLPSVWPVRPPGAPQDLTRAHFRGSRGQPRSCTLVPPHRAGPGATGQEQLTGRSRHPVLRAPQEQ